MSEKPIFRYAEVTSGVVTNITKADADVARERGWVPAADDTAIGDLWDGAVFSKPPPPPVKVPQSVEMRQARLALLGAGLLSKVDAAIAALPSPQKEAAQIEWEYSNQVHRDRALVRSLAPALQLTDAQVDALFIAAAQIE